MCVDAAKPTYMCGWKQGKRLEDDNGPNKERLQEEIG